MKKKRFFKCLSVFSLLLALVFVFSSCAGLGSSLNNIKDGILDIFDESGKKPGGADVEENDDLVLTVKYVGGIAKLSWNEISGVDTYTVYKNDIPQTASEFNSNNVQLGDKVCVVASAGGRDLFKSNEVVLLKYPAPEISGSYGAITIKNNTKGISAYLVMGSNDGQLASGNISAGQIKNIFVTDSKNGVVSVSAIISGNEGVASNVSYAEFQPGTVIHSLSAPTVTVNYVDGKATIICSEVEGATGYKYYLNGSEINTNVFDSSNCENGDTVYARAYNANVTSAASNTVILKKLEAPSIAGSRNHVYVASNITGVNTYVKIEDEAVDGNDDSWHLVGMINGEAECYAYGNDDIHTWYAYNSASGWIDSDTVQVAYDPPGYSLKAPEIVMDYTGGIGTLSYSPVSGAAGYQVYKNNIAIGTNVFTANNSRHGDTVYVKAYSGNVYSQSSNTLALNVLSEPAVVASNDFQSVIVNLNVSGATCHVSSKDIDSQEVIMNDSFTSSSKSYSVDTDHLHQSWSAYNSMEGYINSNTVTIEVGAFLPAPVISIAYSDGKATVTHDTVNGADGYYVYKNGVRIDTLTFDAENCSDGDVITVKAYNVQGLTSDASNSVTIRKLASPSISGKYNEVYIGANVSDATTYVKLEDEGTDNTAFDWRVVGMVGGEAEIYVTGSNDRQTWYVYNSKAGYVNSNVVTVTYEFSLPRPYISVTYADGKATIAVEGATEYVVYKNGEQISTNVFTSSNCNNGDKITVAAKSGDNLSELSNTITLQKLEAPSIDGSRNHVYVAANVSDVTTFVKIEDEGTDGNDDSWHSVGMIDGEAEVYAYGDNDIHTWYAYNSKSGWIDSDTVTLACETVFAASVASLEYNNGVATLSYTLVAGADGYRILKNGSEITTTTFNANNCENGDSIYVEAYTDEGLVSMSNVITIKKCPEPSISGQ